MIGRVRVLLRIVAREFVGAMGEFERQVIGLSGNERPAPEPGPFGRHCRVPGHEDCFGPHVPVNQGGCRMATWSDL